MVHGRREPWYTVRRTLKLRAPPCFKEKESMKAGPLAGKETGGMVSFLKLRKVRELVGVWTLKG
jgi:hypothetical protein